MKKILGLSLLVSVVFLGGCTQKPLVVEKPREPVVQEKVQEKSQKQSIGVKKISVEEFEKELKDTTKILLDIRTPAELRETGVLRDDVVNIDFYEENYKANLEKLDKNAAYLIYCRSGNRTRQTLEIMKELGFVNVLDLGKGIKSWVAAGKKTFSWKENTGVVEELRVIEVNASRFKFEPSEIHVKKGEKVALRINDLDAAHGAQFGEMEVFYEENGNIILDTSTPGEYEFRCATMCGGGHMGMRGKVIVE